MKKSIIFDWGGVILREAAQEENIGKYYSDKDAIVDTFKYFNNALTSDEAYAIYRNTLTDEKGRMISTQNDYESKLKWFNRINKIGNLKTDFDTFVKVFEEKYTKIDKYDEIVEYIYSLKGRANLYLLSDLIFVHYKALPKHIDLNVFDQVFLSYKEGKHKSNIDAFINVEEKIKEKGLNILLVDNFDRNINNAKKRNWNTCLATGLELDKIKASVEEFLK